ncbi:hypothetical protein V7157_19445 [Neobacillus drentensis]|uniref:hypothetical protein n=1 Tax=Neobacillus drentensis TaxID=220684 RepID=UPI0030039885
MGRKISEPNVFVIVGNTVYIHLVGKHGAGKVAITDLWSFKKHNIDTHSWKCTKNYYVYTVIEGKMVFLHGLILENTDPKLMVDHKNGSEGEKTLDNRRSNLRVCTNTENQLNAKVRIDNKTGYKNVNELNGKFRCMIRVDKVRQYFGGFDKPEQAALCYNICIPHFSKVHQLNEIPEGSLTPEEIEQVQVTAERRLKMVMEKYEIHKYAVDAGNLLLINKFGKVIDKIV